MIVICLIIVVVVVVLITKMYICLTLNYHTFNANCIYLRVTLMVRFKANFLFTGKKKGTRVYVS